jgi:large subunit ribosomal protein L3
MAVDGIIGIKLGMTQVFAEDGTSVPCTVLQAGPCVVVQRRSADKDGTSGAWPGRAWKPQRINKAMTGHFNKANAAAALAARFRLEAPDETRLATVCWWTAAAGELVNDRRGKGRGFAGGVALEESRGEESHGSMFHRAPGSIGERFVARLEGHFRPHDTEGDGQNL